MRLVALCLLCVVWRARASPHQTLATTVVLKQGDGQDGSQLEQRRRHAVRGQGTSACRCGGGGGWVRAQVRGGWAWSGRRLVAGSCVLGDQPLYLSLDLEARGRLAHLKKAKTYQAVT